jgi:hypothetical protein
MKVKAHLCAQSIALLCVLMPASARLQETDSVQGLIEGWIHADSKPLVGAIITACVIGHEMKYRGVCTDRIKSRTDSTGGFSLTQTTGRAWPSAADVKKNPILAIADPGYAYGFRVDYEGRSAIFVASGMGYGRTHARMNCDFQAYVNSRQKQGLRPIADSANPEFAALYCKIDEKISTKRE